MNIIFVYLRNSMFCFFIKIDKFRGFAFITFDDYDSVDRCILEKPHNINGKELDVRKAIPREQTTRLNGFILNNNNNNLNTDFYQSHLMMSHPTIATPSYAPYAYFPPSNYLSKPMPLMGTTNSGVLHPPPPPPSVPPTFLFPPELATSAFIRNQTFPSPPPSTSSSNRTNHTLYQNGNKQKSNNEQISTSNDTSKNIFTTGILNYSTPMRAKSR